MIESILIINKLGLLRFIKIYSDVESKIDKKELVTQITDSIQNSKDAQIIYEFDYNGEKRKMVFRLFGSIYIVMIIDDLENELAILDFINVMMQIFDELFKGVCELHIIMNPEKVFLLMDEMISGGMVIETNKAEVMSNFQDKLKDDENYKFFSNSS